MADSDKKILLGATFGPAYFRQHSELTPYGNTNYDRTNIHMGMEVNTSLPLIPFVPISESLRVLRWTVLFDAAFDYTGGDATNIGSHRYAAFARMGTSIRLGTMDKSELIIRGRVGIGPSYDVLNFGKGTVPSGEWNLAMQAQASASFVYCLSKDFCVGPQFGYNFGANSKYGSGYYFLGFSANRMINPPPYDGSGKTSPQKPPEPVKCPDCPPQVTCPDPVKCPDPIVCPTCKECPPPQKYPDCPPPIECQKCQDTMPLVRDIAECKEKVRQIEGEKKQCQDTLREISTPKYLVTVIPQRMILFQNDMFEIARLQQRFPGKGVGKRGKTNPTLDSVIRRVHAWMTNIARLSRGLEKPAYTIDLTISGYANDTGISTASNQQLADERTSAVISYLAAATHVMGPYGESIPNLSGPNIIKVGSVPIVKISREYASKDPLQDIMRLLLNGNDPSKLDDIQRRQLESDAKNPDWRMAMIEYRIMKLDGDKYHEIPVEEFSETFSHTMKPGGE